MLYLKEANLEDLEKEYEFSLPTPLRMKMDSQLRVWRYQYGFYNVW
jgi:hypothetical protein